MWKPSDMTYSEFRDWMSERRRKDFLDACRSPGMWRYWALIHKRGADLLYDRCLAAWERNHARQPVGELCGQDLEDTYDMALIREYLLLAGYALECALKGCLVAIDPAVAGNGEALGKKIRTHKLVDLCHSCFVDLSADEERLTKLITRHVEWGRYPVPTKVSDMPGWELDCDEDEKSIGVSNAFINSRLQVLVSEVFDRVLGKLDEERKRHEESAR